MIRSAASKAMWVGRTTAAVIGLAIALAVVFGVATMALAAVPGDPFKLGKVNTIDRVSTLVGTATSPMLKVENRGTGTALDLRVQAGKPPMRVNSTGRVPRLNAALAGRADSATSAESAASANFASTAANAANAANAERLDDKDIGELPGTVVQAENVAGEGSTVLFGPVTFAAPPVTVTTSSTQRLVGVISVPLKLDSGAANPLTFNYGLCYRQAGSSDSLVNFSGANHPQGTATTTLVTWTAAATKVPGVAGTWEVGFCAQNASDQFVTLRGAGRANGWIEVVNP